MPSWRRVLHLGRSPADAVCARHVQPGHRAELADCMRAVRRWLGVSLVRHSRRGAALQVRVTLTIDSAALLGVCVRVAVFWVGWGGVGCDSACGMLHFVSRSVRGLGLHGIVHVSDATVPRVDACCLCSPGHFCPQGTSNALANPCPAGRFSDRDDAISALQCETCPPRVACLLGTGGSSPAVACSPGEPRVLHNSESRRDGERGLFVGATCAACLECGRCLFLLQASTALLARTRRRGSHVLAVAIRRKRTSPRVQSARCVQVGATAWAASPPSRVPALPATCVLRGRRRRRPCRALRAPTRR
jgi:hypothetical protein